MYLVDDNATLTILVAVGVQCSFVVNVVIVVGAIWFLQHICK